MVPAKCLIIMKITNWRSCPFVRPLYEECALHVISGQNAFYNMPTARSFLEF